MKGSYDTGENTAVEVGPHSQTPVTQALLFYAVLSSLTLTVSFYLRTHFLDGSERTSTSEGGGKANRGKGKCSSVVNRWCLRVNGHFVGPAVVLTTDYRRAMQMASWTTVGPCFQNLAQ